MGTKRGNDNKDAFLGMPHGTANNKLKKAILFDLVKKCNLDTCYRCGGKIEDVDCFSVEHKKAWLNVDVELFWSLDNIAFSHLRCNSLVTDRTGSRNKGEKNWNAKLTAGQVKEIKKELEKQVPQVVIAKKYGVCPTTVMSIKSKRSWWYVK